MSHDYRGGGGGGDGKVLYIKHENPATGFYPIFHITIRHQTFVGELQFALIRVNIKFKEYLKQRVVGVVLINIFSSNIFAK